MNDENEPMYELEEEESEQDDSPLNYAQTQELEEEEISEDESISEKTKKSAAFSLLFQIMFNPVQGWKKLRRQKINVEYLQGASFYPLLALLALSEFADYFYSVNITLSAVITKAVIAFVSYFFGYFSIIILLSIFLPRQLSENFEKDFGKDYIVIGLSTLAIFSIITNILPMLWPILIFLPLWTIYLLYQGSRFFKLPENKVPRFMIVTIVSIIGVPLLLDWALTELMPI